MASGYMRDSKKKDKMKDCPTCGKSVKASEMTTHKQEEHSNGDKGTSETWDKTNVRKLSTN